MDFVTKKRRQRRTRAKIRGTASRPRVSVYRSLKRMNVQLIDDETGVTLVAATGKAAEAAAALAKQAQAKGIEKVVFDRSGYKYHGRVKTVAEGLRSGGLKL